MSLLNEVNDPTMKLRLDLAKVQRENEERDELIGKLSRDVATLTIRVTKLIQLLGTKTK